MIADDARFAGSSVWLTTSRRWVTLYGCVRNAMQRRTLARAVAKAPGVERVFDELKVRRIEGKALTGRTTRVSLPSRIDDRSRPRPPSTFA